jgi:dihydrofolate reductase
MTHVRGELTISLDGFGAGLGTSAEHPLGRRGERLHEWMTKDDPVNRAAGESTFAGAGAVVIGHTMLGVGLSLWGPDTFEHLPVFVPTHQPGKPVVVAGGSTFTLVTGATEAATIRGALDAARAAAAGRDVAVLGGPTTLRQVVAFGVVDELRLKVAHTMLGEGVRLFDGQDMRLAGFRSIAEAHAPGVTHVTLVRG